MDLSQLQSLQVLQDGLENAITFAITIDKHKNIQFCNQFILERTSWRKEKVLENSFFTVFYSETENLKKLSLDQFPNTFEGNIVLRNGKKILCRFHTIPQKNNNGEVVAITLLGEDITTEVKVSKDFYLTNRFLQDLLDTSSDLILIFDEEGHLLFANKSFTETLNYEEWEIAVLGIEDIIDPNSYRIAKRFIEYVKNKSNLIDFETIFVTKTNRKVHLRGTLSCSHKNKGKAVFRAVLTDYTAILRAEKARNLYYKVSKEVEKHDPFEELDHLYEQFYNLLNEAIGVDNFLIALKSSEQEGIIFPYYRDILNTNNEQIKGIEFSKYAVATFERPIFMYKSVIEQIVKQKNINTKTENLPKVWLGVPLVLDKKIIGMVIVQSFNKKTAHNKLHLELLTFVSGQLASAILRSQNAMNLRSQSARLKGIIESGSHLMWSLNANASLTQYNQNFADAIWDIYRVVPRHNYSFKKFLEKHANDSNLQFWKEKYATAFKGLTQQFEFHYVSENGEENWKEVYLNPILSEKEKIVEVSAVALDITQKKIIELDRAESERKFRDIFDSLQDVYFRINLEGTIIMISPSVYDLVGESQLEVLGKSITEYYVSKNKLNYVFKTLFDKGVLQNFESQLTNKFGVTKDIISNFRLVYDENRTPVAVEGTARDITELKKASEDLRKAKETAEKSLEVKKYFLSNMSHEIRTPMNGIIGMIDLLNVSKLNEEQKEYISIIKKSSETLLNILNDILDLSKIEAGKMTLRNKSVFLPELIKKLHALFTQQASEKNNILTYNIEENVPQYIYSDETRLLQILSNLTSNALKFTSNGDIKINVALEYQHDNIYVLNFEVNDTGIGISEPDLKGLFQQFNQIDNTYNKNYGGTGLGLAISKELCSLMDGDIGVKSILNEGSTFWFTIKTEVSKEYNGGVLNSSDSEDNLDFNNNFIVPPKILIVDDNQINRQIAETILLKYGCDITLATGGLEAVELVSKNIFDIIFMDIQMPEVDGIEATKKIHSLNLKNQPPIIAMTAFSMQEEKMAFLQAGMDDYIAKPVKPVTLINAVKKWVNDQEFELVSTEKSLNQTLNITTLNELKKYVDSKMINTLYAEFETETSEMIQVCKEAIHQQNIEELLSVLHSIKGTSSTLGVEKLSYHAAFMETELKKENLDEVAQNFNILENKFIEFSKNYKRILFNSTIKNI